MTLFFQILGAILSVLSFAVTITFWVLSGSRKGLGFEVLSIEPLIERKGDEADGLKIQFKGRVVPNPHVVKVRICNAERSMIREADFRNRITLSFEGAKVFPLTEPKCKPEKLAPRLTWETHQVHIQALDLNRDSEMLFTFLVSKPLEASAITCKTVIDDAVDGGEPRRLNVGAPPVIQQLGTLLVWTIYAGSAAGLCFMMWSVVEGIFKDGAGRGVLNLLTLAGLLLGTLVVGRVLRALLDRSRWPDFLR